MTYPLIILGGGLSGLAAGIRYARFGNKVLILEKHNKVGGLNSFYYRQGMLFETGLHSITNYSPPDDRHAPLNRLLRQLKISRRQFITHEQIGSEVYFGKRGSLRFSNNFKLLTENIEKLFPESIDRFISFINEINSINPFLPKPWESARHKLLETLKNKLLVDFILCPLMFYGSSQQHDMDFYQFIIMFRAVFQEGLFRPEGTIKDLLDSLVAKYRSFGGEIRTSSGVEAILTDSGKTGKVAGVHLESGEEILCDCLLSTIGYPETMQILQVASNKQRPSGIGLPALDPKEINARLSYIEHIYVLPQKMRTKLKNDRTIIFYNLAENFNYQIPSEAVDLRSGIICFPDNFQGMQKKDTFQLKTTHLANYTSWLNSSRSENPDEYDQMKFQWMQKSKNVVGKIVGNFQENIVYEDSFTPLTIEKYTSKIHGAIYGSPTKIKDGRTPFENLFLAGTDQGFLGIIGAMLSGVTIVNQCILNKA